MIKYFQDILKILINWGTDVDTLTKNPLLKCAINDQGRIKQHNFELVMSFLSQSIQKCDNKFSANDLLTLAKFTATISLDHHYGQMINIIQKLFCTCIETALQDDDDTAIIYFSHELYSKYNINQLLKMVVNLFLPLKGQIMKKVYTYLTYKLFKKLLGQTNNLKAFPSNIKDWYVYL